MKDGHGAKTTRHNPACLRRKHSHVVSEPGGDYPSGWARRAAQNLIIVLRVIVTLLVTPTGPPLARWNAAYCS